MFNTYVSSHIDCLEETKDRLAETKVVVNLFSESINTLTIGTQKYRTVFRITQWTEDSGHKSHTLGTKCKLEEFYTFLV